MFSAAYNTGADNYTEAAPCNEVLERYKCDVKHVAPKMASTVTASAINAKDVAVIATTKLVNKTPNTLENSKQKSLNRELNRELNLID